MKKWLVGGLLLALAAAGAWWWSSHPTSVQSAAGAENAPLAYAPAGSPFVFGNLQPLPAEVVQKWQQQTGEMLDLYRDLFAGMREQLAGSDQPDDQQALKAIDALLAEFEGKSADDIRRSLGFGLDARLAVYAIGLAPVLRIELADAAALRSFVGRMETALGASLPKAQLDRIDYWTLPGDAKAPLHGVLAIVDGHLVVTLAPRDAGAAVLRQLLGLQRPASGMQASAALQALNQQHGYLPFFSGYVDSAALLRAISQPADEVQQAYLAALELQKPAIDAVCLAEYGRLAEAWPRLSVGYTTLDSQRYDTRFLLETRADIASELMKLRAPMPGAGQVPTDAILNVGLSFKLAALPAVVGKFAGDVAAAPWQCADLADLNQAFEQAKQGIANPALFAAAPVFSGLHLRVDSLKIDFANPAHEPDGSGMLLIGSDNPQSLLAMAKGFAPPLANLDLPADGSPVAVPALPGVPSSSPLFAAINGKVVGLSFGAGEQDKLADFMRSDDSQQPLLLFGISARFYGLLADAMQAGAAGSGDAASRQALQQQAELMRAIYAKMFTRMDMRVELSEQGIELRQQVVVP